MVRRCARHVEIPATGSCPQCGRATCVQCFPAGGPRGLCLDCATPRAARLPGTLLAVLAGLDMLGFAAVGWVTRYEAMTGTRVLTEAGKRLPDVGDLFFCFTVAALYGALIIPAIQFARLRSRRAASIVSIAMLIPCGLGSLVGIPLGIWGLAMIKKIPDDAWGRD